MLGHTKAQQFKFYVDATNCPVMKYQLLCTNGNLLPRDGGIKLWKEDSKGRTLWPCGFPTAIQPSSMWNLETLNEIYKGLLITGTNYLKRIHPRSTARNTNVLATIGGE